MMNLFKWSYSQFLFSWNIVLNLLKPVVLHKKKPTGFFLFLKAFSWETDLWVTLGDFTVKNAKLGKEICIWQEIGEVEWNMVCDR